MYKQALLLIASSLLLTALIPAHAETQVYLTRDADGNPVFSDRRSQDAEEHVVTELPLIPAFKEKAEQKSDTPIPKAVQYTSLSIVSPSNGTNLPNGFAGEIEVSGVLSPGLAEGDKIVLKDKGQVIATNQQTSFALKNLDRGEHIFSMQVIAPNGDIKISSQPVTIFVQRSSSLSR